MDRNQIFTTIEFVDDLIRICVGEYYNEKFYVFDTFKCKCAGLNDSTIVDAEVVSKTITELINLIKEKTEIIVEELILCLPTNSLIIKETAYTSPVTGSNSLISQYDVNEACKVSAKYRHQDDEVIINVVPLEYQLDDGQRMDFAPVRYKSTTFKTVFNVLMLKRDALDSYLNVIKDCSLRVDKYYLDADCLYAGVFDETDISVSILNINKFSTSLTIFKKGKILNMISVPYGTSTIESELKEQLDLSNENDIKNVLYNIGNCHELGSKYLSVVQNDKHKYVNERDLNEIIQINLQVILNNLMNKVKACTEVSDLDIYVTGYGANIKGIEYLIKESYGCNCNTYNSSTLGLNNVSYCQTIGLIKLNYKKISQNKYINLQNDKYNDIIINNNKSSKFDRFLLDEEDLD